ncbi:MAG: hypothetical protein K2W99_05535 [Chthoniobacterales bacterium]|nr:hypothetical protein [Chthoniobacterales bacterium]
MKIITSIIPHFLLLLLLITFFSHPAKADLANYDLANRDGNGYIDQFIKNDRYGTITELQRKDKDGPLFHQVTIFGRISAATSPSLGPESRPKVDGVEVYLKLPTSAVIIDSSMPTVIKLDLKLNEIATYIFDNGEKLYTYSGFNLDQTKSLFHKAEEVVPVDGNGDPWLVEDDAGSFTPHFSGTATLHYSAQIKLSGLMSTLKKYEIEIPIQVYKVD